MAEQNGLPDFSSDWWTKVLEQWEPAQYYGSGAGRRFGRGSPRRQRYFSNAYEDIFKDYLGQVGSEMRGGQDPATFAEVLETDPWTARYTSLPQSARGVTGMAANPRTRFLYNF